MTSVLELADAVMPTAWLNQQFQMSVRPDITPMLAIADVRCMAAERKAAERKKRELWLLLEEKGRRGEKKYADRFGRSEIFEHATRVAHRW